MSFRVARSRLPLSFVFSCWIFAGLAAADEIAVGGRVLLPGGAALPEAEVELLPLVDRLTAAREAAEGATSEPAARALTDPDGRFRLAAPRAGMWRVRVTAPGFVPLVTVLRPLLEPVELPAVTLTPDEGIVVRIVDGQKRPLAGVLVRADTDVARRSTATSLWSIPTRWGVTAADGSVRIARGRAERVAVAAAPAGSSYVRRDGVTGTSVTLRTETAKPRTLEVRGDDGKPVPAVALFLGNAPILAGRTDARGRIGISATDPAVELAFLAGDGRRTELKLEAPKSSSSTEPEPVALPRQVAAAGRVVGADSRRGVAGAIVWDMSRPEEAAVADGSGGFAVTGAEGLRLDLVAGAPGYLPSERYELQLVEDGRTGPAIPLRPAAAVEGRVVDTDDRPIAGAEIELKRRPTPGMMRIEIGRARQPTRAVTDSRGAFRLSPIDPEERWLVQAAAPGFASSETPAGDLEPGRTRSGLRVVLDRGNRLVGLVVDADGNPLADARVTARPAAEEPRMGMLRALRGGDQGPEWKTTTETSGRFQIAGVPKGRVDLQVVRDGFAKRRIGALEVPASDEPVDVGSIALEPGQKLEGVVLDSEGRAIEGVSVRLTEGGGGPTFVMAGPASRTDSPPDALTDPGGWFRVDGLARDADYALRFDRSGYVDKELGGLRAPRAEPLEVRLDPASDVGGRVLDAEERPIAGARVELARDRTMNMGGNVMRMVMSEDATTDAEGRFLFEDQEPGTISLSAVATGWQEARRDDIEIPRGADVTGLELQLEAGAIVEGRVIAPDGRAAIGATVRRVSAGADPLPIGGSATDGNGHYRIEGLPPGPVSIEALHDDFPRAVKDLEARAGINSLDLHFAGGQEVSGRIVDLGGTPVGDAVVRLVSGGRMLGGLETTSTSDGAFRLPGVKDGDWALWVTSEYHAPSAGDVQVRVAGEPVTGVEVRLDPGATVVGTVRGLGADDLARAEVRAQGPTPSFATHRVDPQGRFRIDRLLPGSYDVIGSVATTGRQARAQLVLEPGTTEASVDLEFGGGLTLSGLAIHGERPVSGAAIFAQGLDVDHSGMGETDHEGRFSLGGLEPGRYRIQLQHFASGLAHVEEVDVATSRDVRIEVPTARVEGRVLDAVDRQPLAGAQVSLVAAPGASAPVGRRVTTTDVDGKFRLDSVSDGSYALQASRQGYAAATLPVNVQLGRDVADLRISMDATEGVTLEARLPGGGIPDELRLALLDGAGQAVVSGSFATGENGRVRLTTVPPGAWDLIVTGGGSAVTRLPVKAPSANVSVPLAPASRLALTVKELTQGQDVAFVTLADASGVPFRSVDWAGIPRSEWRLAGGHIEFAALPAGDWNVQVRAADGRSWQGRATTSAGAPATLLLE